MASAWIVTKGDYSSKQNVAVFTTEEAALAFCRPQWDYMDRAVKVKMGWPHDRYEIEEIELNPVKDVPDTRLLFSISFDEKGDVSFLTVLDPDGYNANERIRAWRNKVEVAIRADSKEQAIKAAAEQRAIYLAEHEEEVFAEAPLSISIEPWMDAMMPAPATFLSKITIGDPVRTMEWGFAKLDTE